MKSTFIKLFMFAAATEAAAQGAVQPEKTETTPSPAPEPTSEKLTLLKKEVVGLVESFQKTKYGTKEYNDGMMKLLAKEKEISAEISEIRKQEAEQKLIEARNARIAIRNNYKIAVLANVGKNANAETAAAELAAETALDNLLLPAQTKTAEKADVGGERGATSQKIEAELRSRIDGGMPVTEAVNAVIALGFSRGTVGTVRTKYWPAK